MAERYEMNKRRAERVLRCLDSDDFIDGVTPFIDQQIRDLQDAEHAAVMRGDQHAAALIAGQIEGRTHLARLHDECVSKVNALDEENVVGLDSIESML